MDIDDVIGAFELPSDRPHWEAALLAELSDPPMGPAPQEQASAVERKPMCTAVLLPFTRRAAA